MRVAFFGGSFNPPHIAHALVALYVLETAPVDALWFAPTWQHPFAKPLAPFDHRVAMCERVAQALGPRAAVSRIEAERADSGEPSYTLYTLQALAARHPGWQFRLVIGEDVLGDTDKWHRWDDVVALAPPILVGRGGVEVPGAHVGGVEMPAISSTEVRRRLRAGEAADALVPASVLRYIAEHGLYRDAP